MLDLVQFPWRTLTFFEFALCMLLAIALDSKQPRGRMLLRLMTAVIVLMISLSALGRGAFGRDPILVFRSPAVEDAMIAARADAVEYLPSCRNRAASDVITDASSWKIVEA